MLLHVVGQPKSGTSDHELLEAWHVTREGGARDFIGYFVAVEHLDDVHVGRLVGDVLEVLVLPDPDAAPRLHQLVHHLAVFLFN